VQQESGSDGYIFLHVSFQVKLLFDQNKALDEANKNLHSSLERVQKNRFERKHSSSTSIKVKYQPYIFCLQFFNTHRVSSLTTIGLGRNTTDREWARGFVPRTTCDFSGFFSSIYSGLQLPSWKLGSETKPNRQCHPTTAQVHLPYKVAALSDSCHPTSIQCSDLD
jgi:hypothetical protein